eukprot:13003207-Alexandrium_andersonii.AAC.1
MFSINSAPVQKDSRVHHLFMGHCFKVRGTIYIDGSRFSCGVPRTRVGHLGAEIRLARPRDVTPRPGE